MNFQMLLKNRISVLAQGVGGREKDRNECEMEMGRNAFQRPPLALPHLGEIWPVLVVFSHCAMCSSNGGE